MPATVTSIAPPVFTHSKDCDLRALGQTVRDLRAGLGADRHVDSRPNADLLDQLIEIATRSQRDGSIPCDCAELALKRVENSLRLARKSVTSWQGKHPYEEMHLRTLTCRVRQLTAQRDALRAAAGA